MLGGVSITTAATHVRVLCMRYCNGLIAYILLHYLMEFHLEITKDEVKATFLRPIYMVCFSICAKAYMLKKHICFSVYTVC